MYLSQVVLKVHDSYEQHQAIWGLFPNAPDRKRDHLFRVEDSGKHSCNVLLQSATHPESCDAAEVLATKEFKPSISKDSYYKFKLVAYPTKRLSKEKKVIEIKSPEEQVQWLQGKLEGNNVQVTSMESFIVNNKKSFKSRFVCFEGIIQALSSEVMERALVMGIGRKKHAGAGLLSLARTR